MKASCPDILARFGRTVRTKRIALDLTQEVLAEKAELHRTYIADIERGTRNVSLRNIERLALALECSIPTLFADIEKGAK
jgi:transcriptional regulator with XRE-family HTH domain